MQYSFRDDLSMSETTSTARIVLSTAANRNEAERLARAFVQEQLAACVTMIPSAESVYRWNGAIESAAETLLLIKTTANQLPGLEKRLHELHSYDTPEFLVLSVDSGSAPYLEWLQSSVQKH
jgi:periplasmic divalent cation tolerance protein